MMKTLNRTPTTGVLTPPGERRFWLILAQWIWNLRLELEHVLRPAAMRTTEFAPAQVTEEGYNT